MPTLFDLYGIDLGQPEEPPPPPKSGLIRRAVGDTAVSAVKGAIGLPEAAVGLADIVTGGRVGKALENEGGTVGFRPKQTREYLDTLYSPEQQAANREVQQAEGFFDTAYAALRNPSTIAHAVVESAPSMLGAAGAARGLMAVASKVNPLVAVGAGEGIFSAGSAAEQIRQQTDDGRLTAEQSLIAAGSGALTGLIGGVAGKIANKLGIGDVQQMLAGVQQAGPKAEKALTRALLEGFATEGVLQELPQSAQEQIAQNVALGKPWDEGVGNAAAMGTLAGGVMGVGGAAIGRLRPQPAPVDPLAEGNARADAAMERLATTNDVGQMIDAAREIATATPLQPLAISPEQEASVMQAGEELAQADLTDMKNMGRLDKTPSRGVEQFAPIVPASEEGPAPFLDRLLTATEALQDPAVRQRVEQAAGPQYLAQLDQYAEVANTPGFMDGIGDQVRDRHLELLERAVFPERFRKPAPQIQRAERRRSDPVPIEPFRAEPVTDPVLDYVDAKRAENTMAARAFVKEFEAGRITRRDVVRVMQDRNADPLGSNPDPLASIQPATPAPNLIQQRLEAAARAGQAQPTGIQIEPSRARPKGQSDERNPERAVPGEGRPVDTGNQPGTSGVVSGELQQPGAPGPAGTPVPSAVQGVDAERAGRGLGDDALKTEQPDYLTQLFGTPAQQAEAQKRFEASEGERKGQQAADAKRIREAIEAEKKRAQKELDDWSGRSYKANKTQIDLRGDGPSNQASMSIGAINESRRRNAMDALSQELRALEKIAKEVADDATAAQFVAKMRQSYQQAEGTARNGGWAGFKTADELFQYGLLDGLKFRGPSGKGNVTSNGLSRAVLQAIKGAPNGQEAQEAAQDGDSTARTGGTGRSNVAPVGSAQAQAGTPAEGAGTTRPTPARPATKAESKELRERGEQPGSRMDAERLLMDGWSLFASHEQDEGGTLIRLFSSKDAEAFTPDQLMLLPPKSTGPKVFKTKTATRPLDTAANEAATSPQNDLPEPTEAQKEAGNYKVGRIKVAGLDISVENPAGSERSGIDPDGKKWRNTLAHHYGYIRRSEGADGDHVDVFVNPGTPEDYDGQVFVVDQADPKTGRFDEHKVMMGFPSAKAAQEAYQANYAKDWTGLRAVQPMTMEQFKAWVSDPANTKKPAAKGVKPGKGEKVERPDELVELRKRESALKSLRECLG